MYNQFKRKDSPDLMNLSEQIEEFRKLLEKTFHLEDSIQGIHSDLFKYKSLFEKLGGQKAIFANLAKLVGELISSNEDEYPDKFSAVLILLNNIRISLSSSCESNEHEEYCLIEENIPFRNDPWSILQPLVKALSINGSGRLKVLQQSYLLKTYQNRQVLPLIIDACGDSYSQVSDLALKEMLPFFGYGGALALRRSLKIKGGKSELNKLRYLLRFLKIDDLKSLYIEVLDFGNIYFKKEVLKSGKTFTWMKPYLELLINSRSPELSKLAQAAFEKLPG